MITIYKVKKNNKVIKEGLSPTFYVHGMMSSIMEKNDPDSIEIEFENKIILTMLSPRLLFEQKPNNVSSEQHIRWFSGCRYL